MITSLTIRTTIWSVHRKIATKHLIRYQMHFAFVYFVNNRYDKRIPLIKWLIVISKRIVSFRSLSVSMFLSLSLSLSLSLPSQNHLNPDLYINDIQLSITNILYFVALFLLQHSCLTVVCLRSLRRRKTTVSMNFTNLP